MSQEATLYLITQDDFLKIVEINGKKVKPLNFTDQFVTFQSSFMALEYVLSKGLTPSEQNLIQEIFNPTQSIGSIEYSDIDFEKMSEEEMWNILDSVGYIPAEKANEINNLLIEISENDVSQKYDAAELNSNDVYPGVWQKGDADNVLNRRYILEEFRKLKDFFKEAAVGKHLILPYVG